MARQPRRLVIREDEVGVYHVWTRTVRQMWLMGKEAGSGRNYEYRKQWIEERLELLAQVFAIDACVYAILSNHYHLLLRNRPDLVVQMSDEEVVRRWWLLFPERRLPSGKAAEITPTELRSWLADAERIADLRERLSSISWFMKTLNEWLARRANREDDVVGHFVEDRFKCRSLLDEGAILTAALYIDLNEIRAGLAGTPEQSRYTSGYRRILRRLGKELKQEAAAGDGAAEPVDWLCPVDERARAELLGPEGAESVAESRAALAGPEPNGGAVRKRWRHGFLSMTVEEYLQVLDWAGREVVEGKTGSIDPTLPPILERLGLVPSIVIKMVTQLDEWFGRAVGEVEHRLDASLGAEQSPRGASLSAADG